MAKTNKERRIIFMGSTEFSAPILFSLIKSFQVVAVITETDKPAGRNKKMVEALPKIIAERENIHCLQPERIKGNKELLEKIASLSPDVIVVAAYGQILPKEILNLPKHGCVNVHPSLLPEYRGASPIQTALLKGEKKTGVTLIMMDRGMDSGDIIAQEPVEIAEEDNYDTLGRKLAEAASFLLIRTLPEFIADQIKLIVQDDTRATYCSKIKKEDGRIDWDKPANEILNKIRAFSTWPGSYSSYENRKIEIVKAEPRPGEDYFDQYAIGQVYREKNKICVQCAEGSIILQEVKLEGKNKTAINDFVNGHQSFIGSILR